jgi:molecular chaperone HtpG
MDIEDIVLKVVEMRQEKESKDAHYFEVIIKGVDEKQENLLDEQYIESYISQVAPVPFHAVNFPFYSDKQVGLKTKLSELGKQLEEYNIYLNDNPQPIYKPYRTWFHTTNNSKDKERDDIKEIKYITEYSKNGELLFWGWYSISNFYGTVKDPDVAGLRIRKNNILIGNGRTLDSFFTQSRFNRWFIGEIHVYDKDLIPNGRRDNFEINDNYNVFKEKLENYTKKVLSKLPSEHSQINSAIAKFEKCSKTLEEIEIKANAGISSEEERKTLFNKRDYVKSTIDKSIQEISKVKEKIQDYRIKNTLEETLKKAEKLQTRTIQIENKIIDANYLLDSTKALAHLSKDVKKVVIKIFEVLDKELKTETAKDIQKKIIEALKAKGKNN